MYMSRERKVIMLQFIQEVCRNSTNLVCLYIWRHDEPMLDGTSILYVEDNPDNQILIMRILMAEGYKVSFAANGTEALDRLESQDYDLLLLDINLPDIDGYTLTDIIRQNERFKNTPILALTANVMKGDRERSLNAGCDGYIQKPINVDDLPFQIEYYLKR